MHPLLKTYRIGGKALICALMSLFPLMTMLPVGRFLFQTLLLSGALFLLGICVGGRKPFGLEIRGVLCFAGTWLWMIPWIILASFLHHIVGFPMLFLATLGVVAGALTRRISLPAFLLLLGAPFLLITTYAARAYASYCLLLLAAFILASCLAPEPRHYIPAPVRVAFFSSLACIAFLLAIHFLPDMTHPIDLREAPEARHVLPLERAVRQHETFVVLYQLQEGCEGRVAYLTNNLGRPGVWSWNRQSDDVLSHDEFDGSADNILFECQRNRITLMEFFTGNVIRFDGRNLDAPWRVLRRELRPCKIFRSLDSRIYYILRDGSAYLKVMGPEGDLLIEDSPRIGAVEGLVPLGDHTFLTGDSGVLRHYGLDLESQKLVLLGSAELPGTRPWYDKRVTELKLVHFAHGDGEDVAYASEFLTGRLFEVKLPLEKIRLLAQLRPGIRHLVAVPEYDWIVVGNFITGELSIVSRRDGSLVHKRKVGSRLRWVTLSRDRRRVYVVSPNGIIEVDLQRVADIHVASSAAECETPAQCAAG